MTTKSRGLVHITVATSGCEKAENLEQVGSLGKGKPIAATGVEDHVRG